MWGGGGKKKENPKCLSVLTVCAFQCLSNETIFLRKLNGLFAVVSSSFYIMKLCFHKVTEAVSLKITKKSCRFMVK